MHTNTCVVCPLPHASYHLLSILRIPCPSFAPMLPRSGRCRPHTRDTITGHRQSPRPSQPHISQMTLLKRAKVCRRPQPCENASTHDPCTQFLHQQVFLALVVPAHAPHHASLMPVPYAHDLAYVHRPTSRTCTSSHMMRTTSCAIHVNVRGQRRRKQWWTFQVLTWAQQASYIYSSTFVVVQYNIIFFYQSGKCQPMGFCICVDLGADLGGTWQMESIFGGVGMSWHYLPRCPMPPNTPN